MLLDEVIHSHSKVMMNMLGPASARRRMVDKVWYFLTQQQPKETNMISIITAACLLALKTHQDHFIRLDERERSGTNAYASNMLPYMIGHLPTK